MEERHGPHAHLQGQGPAGHVVRGLGFAGGGEPGGVLLPLHHVLQMRAIGLVGQQDVAARRVGRASVPHLVAGAVDADARVLEDADHLGRRAGVAAVHRHDPAVRRLRPSLGDRGACHREVVALESVLVPRGERQERPGADPLVVLDVRLPPPAARPGIDEVDGRAVVDHPASGGAEVRFVHEDRGGQVRARRLGQHGHDVVALRGRPVAAIPPVVVQGMREHAFLVLRREVRRHVRPDHRDRLVDARVEVRVDRVIKRRHEQPGPARAHLMHVVRQRREPFLVEQMREELRLLQVEHEPVAVGVVARVLVIEADLAVPFPGLPLGAVVPVGHDVDAVGVGRRDDDHDRLVQHFPRLGIVARRQVVQQPHGHERRGRLGRVDRARDEDDGLALGDQVGDILPLGQRDAPLHGLVAIEVADRLGAGDEGGKIRPPLGRLAEFLDDHAVGRGVELGQIAGHFGPFDERIIGGRRGVRHVAGNGEAAKQRHHQQSEAGGSHRVGPRFGEHREEGLPPYLTPRGVAMSRRPGFREMGAPPILADDGSAPEVSLGLSTQAPSASDGERTGSVACAPGLCRTPKKRQPPKSSDAPGLRCRKRSVSA